LTILGFSGVVASILMLARGLTAAGSCGRSPIEEAIVLAGATIVEGPHGGDCQVASD
jgi:methylglyoxal synthase